MVESILILLGFLIVSFFIIGVTSKPKTRKMTIKEEKEYLLK